MDVTGRRVFITGASSGIGEATARMFAARGAIVAICSEQDPQIHDVAASIRGSGGKAFSFLVDFGKPDQVSGLLDRIEAEAGPLDVVVNNAGLGVGATIPSTRPEDLRLIFEVNFFALAEICRQALVSMSRRGAGRIVNVSSAAGLFGSPTVSAYSATKGAVHAYTQALRIEAAEWGIGVTEVLPISVRTRFFENVKGKKYQPKGVVIDSERVARCIVKAVEARNAPPEALPFRPIRLVFIATALFPRIIYGFGRSRYLRSLRKTQPTKR